MISPTFHAIGCASGIGRWLIEFILKDAARTFCYDVSKVTLARLPKSVISCLITEELPYANYKDNFADGDIIIFAVPPDQFRKSLLDIKENIRPGSLLVACNSVQGPAMVDLNELAPSNCYFMGCHCLFAPTVQLPDGFSAVLTEYDDNPIKRHFADLITNSGLSIVSLPTAEHDHYMAIVQTLTHFCLLTFCKTVLESDVDLTKLKNVRTPNFQFLYAFGSRISINNCWHTNAGHGLNCAREVFEFGRAIAPTVASIEYGRGIYINRIDQERF